MKEKRCEFGKLFKVFLLLGFISCETKKNELSDDYRFEVIDPNYTINLDHLTSNYEMASQYLPAWNGREAFAFLNRKNNEIKIYDLNSGNKIDSIQFSSDGPDGVGRIYEFFIHNEDSIFLNARYAYKIKLIDKNSKLINEYSVVPEDTEFDKGGIPKGVRTALPLMFVWHTPTLLDGSLYIYSAPDRDPMKADYYDSKESIIKMDLSSGSYKYLMGFPESYKGRIWGPDFKVFYSAFNKEKKTFTFSYPIDENIYQTSDFGTFETHHFGSNDVPRLKPMPNPSNQFSIYYKYYKYNSAYANVLYDQYNSIYYRIANLKINEEDYAEPTTAMSNPQDFLVIVCDDAFNILHEETFQQPSNGQFITRMSFVNETGLNMAFVDFENEDKLKFVSFKIDSE